MMASSSSVDKSTAAPCAPKRGTATRAITGQSRTMTGEDGDADDDDDDNEDGRQV